MFPRGILYVGNGSLISEMEIEMEMEMGTEMGLETGDSCVAWRRQYVGLGKKKHA